MRTCTHLTQSEIDLAKKLREQGEPWQYICERLKCKNSTVRCAVKRGVALESKPQLSDTDRQHLRAVKKQLAVAKSVEERQAIIANFGDLLGIPYTPTCGSILQGA